jgi:hypothetical protein
MAGLKRIVRLLNQPCKDMTGLVSKAMDTELPFWERVAANLHLLYCRACRRYKKHLLVVRGVFHRLAEEVEDPDIRPTIGLSPEARERIRHILRSS